MINKNIFRAYDIRGVYPEEIDSEVVCSVVDCLVKIYQEQPPLKKQKKIIVGYDARLSSPILYRSVIGELKKFSKIKIIKGGIMTTPMSYFLINYLKADGGIVITASHNPYRYNGIKMSKKNAEPINGIEVLRRLKNDKKI